MLNEKLELLLDKFNLPINTYYTPYYASCPICGGSNSIRIRQNVECISIFTNIECVTCRTGGSVDEWLDILENTYTEGRGRHKELAIIYAESLEYSPQGYCSDTNFLNEIGYYSPDLPPGNAFSIISREKLLLIKPKLNILRDKPNYIIIPLYRHIGKLDDFLLFDGKFFERLSVNNYHTKYNGRGFCGTVRSQYLDKLFVVPSPLDMIKVLNRQRSEKVPDDMFHIIVDMSRHINEGVGPGCLVFDSVQADNVYFLADKSDIPFTPSSYPGGIAGCVKVIKNYKEYSIIDIAVNADRIAKKVGRRKWKSLSNSIDARRYPYRYFLDGDNIFVHRVLLGAASTTTRGVKKAVSGLIHVERTGRGLFTVRTKQGRRATCVYLDTPEEMFEDMEVFNSYLLSEGKRKKGEKPVQLLDWFHKRTILPNLLQISKKTAEVLKKESRDATKN